jgi:2-iminobutanoate/2-iminopropanoate deaminase
MLEYISTDKAPAAIGPYSQAVKAGNFLFLSGVMPINPETNTLVEDEITCQTEQIMKNIDAVLTEAGYSVENVVKTTCFLSDISNFARFNEIYGNYFISKPARSCVAAKDLPKGALAEVEVIAFK